MQPKKCPENDEFVSDNPTWAFFTQFLVIRIKNRFNKLKQTQNHTAFQKSKCSLWSFSVLLLNESAATFNNYYQF